jgi:thioredoxin reductase
MKIAIIGGGPIGIEAALYASVAGFEVQLFERGRIGENARTWGHVEMFTEWKRNRSPLGEKLLRQRGDNLPPAEEYPTGNSLADYLLRLVSLPELKSKVVPQTQVLSITRDGLNKGDLFGDPRRNSQPFRLVTKGIAGEKARKFDAILDCTGVYTSPNNVGIGGAKCIGESTLTQFIDYTIPDIAGADRLRFAGKHTVVVGSGHSAAQTALAIADLMEKYSKTRLTWVVRRSLAIDGSLYLLDPNDNSTGRRKLGERANHLVRDSRVDLRVNAQVEAISRPSGRFNIQLSDGSTVDCDSICAHTGFRPDRNLWSELQVNTNPATDGPVKLAQAILESNRRAGVGLSTGYAEKLNEVEKPEANGSPNSKELLKLNEPNFYVLGAKSYGRDAGFLIHNGFRQIRDVFQLLSGNENLNLYEGL